MTSAAAVVAILVASTVPAGEALPEPDRLFGCPLDVAQTVFEAPDHWNQAIVPGRTLSVRLPPGWVVDAKPGRFEAHAPDQSIRVSLRYGTGTASGGLATLRRSMEAAELGQSYVRDLCAERVTTALRNEAPWTDISFGYYGRPLGERRRRVALFAGLDGGPMAAVVSTRWSREQPGPRWSTVWQILGGLRGSPAPAGTSLAQVTPLHVH